MSAVRSSVAPPARVAPAELPSSYKDPVKPRPSAWASLVPARSYRAIGTPSKLPSQAEHSFDIAKPKILSVSDEQANDTSDAQGETGTATTVYTDGEYRATGSYSTPGGQESVAVSLTLANDVVTAVSVEGSAQGGSSQRYQSEFIANIASQVVGVAVDELNVSKVAGSSLTSAGFNAALSQILATAQA